MEINAPESPQAFEVGCALTRTTSEVQDMCLLTRTHTTSNGTLPMTHAFSCEFKQLYLGGSLPPKAGCFSPKVPAQGLFTCRGGSFNTRF